MTAGVEHKHGLARKIIRIHARFFKHIGHIDSITNHHSALGLSYKLIVVRRIVRATSDIGYIIAYLYSRR